MCFLVWFYFQGETKPFFLSSRYFFKTNPLFKKSISKWWKNVLAFSCIILLNLQIGLRVFGFICCSISFEYKLDSMWGERLRVFQNCLACSVWFSTDDSKTDLTGPLRVSISTTSTDDEAPPEDILPRVKDQVAITSFNSSFDEVILAFNLSFLKLRKRTVIKSPN